jgi:hypothetical protein
MLTYLISIPVIMLAISLVFLQTVHLCRQKASWRWWVTLAAIVVSGGYVGWLLGHCDVQVSPEMVWGGVPLPLGFFHFEDGGWVDYVLPDSAQRCNVVANTVLPIVILLFPWIILRRRWMPRETLASIFDL